MMVPCGSSAVPHFKGAGQAGPSDCSSPYGGVGRGSQDPQSNAALIACGRERLERMCRLGASDRRRLQLCTDGTPSFMLGKGFPGTACRSRKTYTPVRNPSPLLYKEAP